MLVRQIIRFMLMLALAALQVLVLNHIHLFGYATPMLYVAFLLRFPLNASRIGVLLWAFLMGLTVDIGSGTPGMGAAATTLAAMFCHPLLRVMSPRDAADDIIATPQSMGHVSHMYYVVILVVVHHAAFFLLESFTYHHPLSLLISFIASALLSIVLIVIVETLRMPKA